MDKMFEFINSDAFKIVVAMCIGALIVLYNNRKK